MNTQIAIEIYHEAIKKMPEHYQPQSLYNMMGKFVSFLSFYSVSYEIFMLLPKKKFEFKKYMFTIVAVTFFM